MVRQSIIVSSSSSSVEKLKMICSLNEVKVLAIFPSMSELETKEEHKCDILFVDERSLREIDDASEKLGQFKVFCNNITISFSSEETGNKELNRIDFVEYKIYSPFLEKEVRSVLKNAFKLPDHILLLTGKSELSLSLTLLAMGYTVQVLDSVEAALNGEVSILPDFIISEYSLPGTNAVDLKKRLEAIQRFQTIPLLIAYDGRDVSVIEEIIKSEVKDILLSPFDSPGNIKKIQDLFPLPPKGRKLKALVVDDSPTIRTVISGMFKELNYEVKTAPNGFEGYKEVQKFHPDIITSDYDMPVLNGWEFCTEVRDAPESKDIPIIMVTTRASELDIKKGKLLGVSAYLTKPFDTNTLRSSVEEAIRNAKQKKEQETIAKFLAADTIKAVNDMVEGEHHQKGSDKFITLLFSDICSFSNKCEKYPARKIIKLLNTYFDLMVEVLSQYDAIIDKFIGDAIVARFDSGSRTTDALNAVLAGWKMVQVLNEFNEESFEEVEHRIGINSGNVILGYLGCQKHRLEYAMIGDNVNIGQRLEASAPAQGCMISESTYQLVKESAEVSEIKEISVKGKKEKIKAYVLKGVRGV